MGLFFRRVIGASFGACLATAAVHAIAAQWTGQPAPLGAGDEPIQPIPHPPEADQARVALGEALFADRRLSRAGDRACSSCHDIATNGADSVTRDMGPDGSPVKRNTTTVFNATLNYRQNWSGDAPTLRDQARKTFADLLATDWLDALGRLNADSAARARFVAAYSGPATADRVVDAVAAYEETLLTPDSRFDLWLKGDATALSPQELGGYQLFKSVGCVSCHQGMNVGGNLMEKVGVFVPLPGKEGEMLRVPSLRNVAVTPPYFDDGSAKTLEDAVARMARAQLGRQLPPDQISAIVGFLNTLTGRYRGQPLRPSR